MRSERGLSLVEMTIVLTMLAILTAAMSPIAARTVERSRQTRTLTDMQAIRDALSQLIIDLPGAFRGPKIDGSGAGNAITNEVDMLVGDGDIPRETSLTGDARWDDPVTILGGSAVDFIENHLIQNDPFDLAAPAAPYGTSWRGAYLNGPVDPDPWGNRYAVNTEWLEGTATERRNDTFVLSAGPDEQIDSAFEIDGAVAGDDDLIVVVRRDTGELVP